MSSKNELERRFQVWQMRQAGLSQTVIAEKLGISQSSVSGICQFLDDAENLLAMIAAEEEPIETGNANLDALAREAQRLEKAKARMRPDSALYLKTSEQASWLRVKLQGLQQALPQGKSQERYEYKAISGCRPTPKLTQIATDKLDRALLQDFELAHRVARLDCPKCGEQVWAQVDMQYQAPALPEAPTAGIDYSAEEEEGEVRDTA